MNLSFIPGDLHLKKNTSGDFVVTMSGQEILSSKSQRIAVARFNALRAELAEKIPMHVPTAEEKAELLQKEINNSLVGHNSLGGRKKKSTAGSSRTFGG